MSDKEPEESKPVIQQTPSQPPPPSAIRPPQPSPLPAIPQPQTEPVAEIKETVPPDTKTSRSSVNESLPAPRAIQQPSPSPSQKSTHEPAETKPSIPLPVVDLSAPKKPSRQGFILKSASHAQVCLWLFFIND